MADDRDKGRRDEEEFKIVVRDRRRVTTEGDLREVEEPAEADAPQAPPPPPPAAEPPAERPAPPPRSAKAGARRGGGLGGAEQARVRRETPLREVPDEDDDATDAGQGDEGDAPRISNIYEYTEILASQLCVWSLASLGLMPHPATGIVTVDLDQAEFGIDAAEALIDTLIERDKLSLEALSDLYRSLVAQFGSVAAQLLNQPPQVRLQEIRKVRFCIDCAERFAQSLGSLLEHGGDESLQPKVAEVTRFLNDLRLAYVQASGGGGIVG